MINFLKKLFAGSDSPHKEPIPDPDYDTLLEAIIKKENSEDIQPGKRIHKFDYRLFSIRLDRDITKNYRITVFQGNERIYSFTVFAKKGDFTKLRQAYPLVINFLKSEQNITELPDSDLLKGFFFGH